MSGPILDAEGTATVKNDQNLPAWSLPSRKEGESTNKESELDEINPDNDKCYEENRTNRIAVVGEGRPLELRAWQTFLRGILS